MKAVEQQVVTTKTDDSPRQAKRESLEPTTRKSHPAPGSDGAPVQGNMFVLSRALLNGNWGRVLPFSRGCLVDQRQRSLRAGKEVPYIRLLWGPQPRIDFRLAVSFCSAYASPHNYLEGFLFKSAQTP